MRERGILMTAPNVRSILAGTKTQTRRIVKITHRTPGLAACLEPADPSWVRRHTAAELCPYGVPGDRLWVRETWAAHWMYDDVPPRDARSSIPSVRHTDNRWYRADGDDARSLLGQLPTGLRGKWRPARFMPRWASRLTLEITDVRVERLQEISRDDAIAEGCDNDPEVESGEREGCLYDPRDLYCSLWESINGRGSWDANPWVWALTFRRVEG